MPLRKLPTKIIFAKSVISGGCAAAAASLLVESSAPADPHPRLRGLDSISWRNIGGALHSRFLCADDMWRWALFLFLYHHGLETTGTGLQQWHWHQQQCVAANVSSAELGPSKQKWTWFHQPTSIHTRKVHRKPR